MYHHHETIMQEICEVITVNTTFKQRKHFNAITHISYVSDRLYISQKGASSG